MEKIYSLKDCAIRLGITRQAVWEAIKTGHLKAFRKGKKLYRISEIDLQKYLTYNGRKHGIWSKKLRNKK